ncbi:MAG: DUF192 domain-containing protein [Ignavibacteria bacterium]|nr:DUF192 domain-containing protein [Ignavibacteria bacterium]
MRLKRSSKHKNLVKSSPGFSKKPVILFIAAIVIGFVVYLLFFRTSEPKWIKEGEVTFIRKDNREVIRKIDVEVAITPQERSQGLMYRSSMDEDKGMLFIFEKEEIQSFWMKNTKIPLDIIFIDSKGVINTIHKNTVPYSERSLPSEKPSRFVVEVNGGFCERNGIREGDLIEYRLAKP